MLAAAVNDLFLSIIENLFKGYLDRARVGVGFRSAAPARNVDCSRGQIFLNPLQHPVQ